MTLDDVKVFIQNQFTDGLVIVVGSGLSLSEGIPGMQALAEYLISASKVTLDSAFLSQWEPIENALRLGEGLEAALLANPPTEQLESWIVDQTAALLMPHEKNVLKSLLEDDRELRLTKLLNFILKPQNGLPIVTTNYDRLVEIACERAGYHVDTTALGIYSGGFDHLRSRFMSCKGIGKRGNSYQLIDNPRAIVLKPHGSFDWYQSGSKMIRCSMEIDARRGIITPGANKYKAGYSTPFDIHRELANQHIRNAARLLIVGYGFNDDHLQTHLMDKIGSGTPTLILTKCISDKVKGIASAAPICLCIGERSVSAGTLVISENTITEFPGVELWDIQTLVQEVLQ